MLAYSKNKQLRTEPIRKVKKRLDAKYSRYIRLRDGLKCRICGRNFQMYENSKGFQVIPKEYQCAHIIDRTKSHTRYKPENLIGICQGCHVKFDGKWTIYGREKDKFRAMAYERCGITRNDLNLLEYATQQKSRPDYAGLELWIDAELAKFLVTKKMEAIK